MLGEAKLRDGSDPWWDGAVGISKERGNWKFAFPGFMDTQFLGFPSSLQVEETPLEPFLLLERDVQETHLLPSGRSAFQQNSPELITERSTGLREAWCALKPRAFITPKSWELFWLESIHILIKIPV